MKTYICGKVTGLPADLVKAKFRAAEDILMRLGFFPVNPITIVNNPEADWDAAMAICIPTLMDCEAIYIQNDWKDSRGSKIEIIIALARKMRIFYEGRGQRIEVEELIKPYYELQYGPE